MELALLVAREPERRMRRVGEPRRRPPRRWRRRRTSCPAGLLQLRAVHEALAAVGHEIGLRVAPRRRARRVHSTARARSNDAMHSRITAQYTMPAVIGSDLAGGDRHHDLVEAAEPVCGPSHGDEGLAGPTSPKP